MKKMIFPVVFSFSLLLVWSNLCLSAPLPKEISRDEVLAKVNGEVITVGRFNDFIKELKAASHSVEGKQKTKEEKLHELIRKLLISQRAASLDLDSDSLFVQLRNLHMRDFLLEYMYQKDFVEKIEVTDQEVQDHYELNKEKHFVIPEQVQVRDLLIRVGADSTQKDYPKRLKKADKEAKKRIEELYRKATASEDFAELCRQHSQGIVPDVSGNLGFIQKGRISPQFDSVAFSLKEKNEISKPVRDFRGYHLIQLLDRKEKSYQPLDSVSFGIREFLKNQKVREATKNFADSLKNAAGFVYNQEALSTADRVVSGGDASVASPDRNLWVMIFGGQDTVRVGEYEDALSGYKVELGKDSLSTEERKEFLDNYLALPAILKKEAGKKGYAQSVEYQAEKRIFTLEDAERRVLAERIKKDFPPPTTQEIQDYYQAHKIDFPSLGVPVHVYHIVFDDSLKAAEVLKQINDGVDFVETAKKYFPGESEIKDVAYDLGFISRGEMPEEFYQAALKLKDGEVSQPVKTSWGFHLIKMVEKKAQETTFQDIVPKIVGAINLDKGRKYMAKWEENLFKQGKVWINKKLLEELELPKPEG